MTRSTKPIGMMRRIRVNETLVISRFRGLSGYDDISHFVTTRHGGVSSGTYASMNPCVYTADDVDKVKENLRILSEAVGIVRERIIMPRQVHGNRVRAIDSTFLSLEMAEREKYLDGVDALVTDLPDICVSVSTADCVPILLYSPIRKVIAAVHAGWRGTVAGIAREAVRFMRERYGCESDDLVVGIGPSISPSAFEVGEEVVDAFRGAGFPMDGLLARDPEMGKAHIDLWEANRWCLLEIGVRPERIEIAGICTYACSEDYFSARRLGIKSGRILTGIFMKGMKK